MLLCNSLGKNVNKKNSVVLLYCKDAAMSTISKSNTQSLVQRNKRPLVSGHQSFSMWTSFVFLSFCLKHLLSSMKDVQLAGHLSFIHN